MTIRIVTESSSDISWEFADKYGIKVVPLSVNYYDKSYKEDRNYDYEAHYDIYDKDENFLPKTSQPSPKEYYDSYKELISQGATDIIVICISSALSGSINSATLAAKLLHSDSPNIGIHIIDSKNASYPEVFLVEEALKQIKKGKGIEEIVQKLNALVKKLKTFIIIPTLKYLHLGGRISIAKYLLGRLLRKMVIIRVNEEGKNETATTIKNIEEGIEKLIELTTEKYTRFPRKATIVYVRNFELADKLEKLVKEKIPNVILNIIRTGVTISAHTGPKALALVSDFGNELDL